MKRFTAILLTICLLLGLLPGVASAAKVEDKEVRLLSAEDYVTADLIWEQIYAVESDLYAKRAPSAERTETLIAVVEASPYYKDGTMSRNGDFFAWETTDGIVCGYSPEIRKQAREATPLEHYDASKTVEVLDFSKKGGSPGKENVYVIQPYYGLDSSFKEQYNNEAATIAADIGGIATTYRTTSATIDNIADAIEDGALVIFDSHGTTDYSNGEDNVSRANTSYLCLQVGTGFTSQDQSWVDGAFARYPHAFYGGVSGDMYYYCVDGTAIANHMEKNASNSFLWMAICLSMATDGIQAPLRKKGVEVAYGYSQSVTFDYDYKWEAAFWDEMLAGKTVAQAAATMKQKVGCWDWCHSSLYDTYEEAIATYSAFPIIVSSEDTYPGHGKVDNYQTVHSSWTLFAACTHENVSLIPATPPTCTAAGNTAYYRCLECNVCFSDASCTEQISQSITVIPATGHSYNEGVVTVAPTCEENGEILYTCTSCGVTRVETMLALGHHYVLGYCETCGMEEPDAVPFEIGHSGEYVIAVYLNGKYYAMLNAFPEANNKISGVEIEVIDGKVKASAAEPYKVTLNYNNGTYTIKNNRVYLKYASGTNLTSAEAAYEWKIAEGTKGSWRITSTLSTTRGVIFRAGTYMLFGGYSTANITTSGNYYDVEILPISSELDIVCEHQSIREEMTIQATCTTDGEISVYCADCGELLGTAPVWATGHTEVKDEAVAATCTEDGLTEGSHCATCGVVLTEQTAVPALGHHYDGAETTAPTCEDAGVMTYTCTNCGDSYTEAISALGHSEVKDEAVAATCTTDGKTEGSHCFVCNAVIVEQTTVPATGHTEVKDEAVAATCTEDGLTEGSHCAVCGATIVAQTTVPALGHSYESAETTAPTCEYEGVMAYTCTNCGDSYTEAIPALGHSEVKDEAVAATCTEEGLTEGSHCAVCGATIVAQTTVPALGHSYESAETTAPTCEDAGVMTYTCARCGDSYTEAIAAIGHTEVTDPAVAVTCTENGLTEGSHCSVCKAVIVAQETIPALGHNYVYTEAVAPTCTQEGVAGYLCSNCGDSYTKPIPATGHKFENGTCTNCGEVEPNPEATLDPSIKVNHSLNLASDISINFAVLKSALEGYDMDTVYMECTMDLYSGNEVVGTKTYKILPVATGNYYYFTMDQLTAMQMNDTIVAVLYGVKNGQKVYSAPDEYSVATYAYAVLNSGAMPLTLKNLCADLLRYGSVAQSYKSYRTDALADSGITEENKAHLSDLSTVTFGNVNQTLDDLANPSVTWIGKTLSMESKVCVKYVFSLSNFRGNRDDLSLHLTYTDALGGVKSFVLTDMEAYSAANDWYSFSFGGLLVAELRTVLSAQLYEGDTPVSATLLYSPDTYGNNQDGLLDHLCRAMFAYSDSAKAFFVS